MNKEQDKQAFFAQYYGQEVLKVPSMRGGHKTFKVGVNVSLSPVADNDFLELRSLEDITDEEAKELGWLDKKLLLGNLKSDEHSWFQKEIDYLRSRGFLLPFRDYSIEDILKLGWVIIKK